MLCKDERLFHFITQVRTLLELHSDDTWKNVKTARLYIDQNTPLRQQRNMKLQKLLQFKL